MSLRAKLLSASGGVDKLYVDDVFSAYTYTGTGATQTITNGIDLAGKGGLVWIKTRSTGTTDHMLTEVPNYYLGSNLTAGRQGPSSTYLNAFNADGFSVGLNASTNGTTYVSWTFRKAPKFFDVVTYTGNAGTKVVPHSLGSAPGMIIVKRTDVAADWVVYHQSVPANCGFLNLTNSFASAQRFSSVTTADFTISVSTADVNASGGTYVAYLFAHDPSADGLIQCGSFTSTTSALNITLGWEPQFLLCKRSSGVAGWDLIDAARGFQVDRSGSTVQLSANTSAAEVAYGTFGPTATGFTHTNGTAGDTYIYLAIRRPNKPPTVGTQVYNAIARTGTGAAATITGVGFAPDLVVIKPRTAVYSNAWYDRLRGKDLALFSDSNSPDQNYVGSLTHAIDGVGISSETLINQNATAYINHFFKRAPGVLSQICYSGTGANKTEAHDLGVAPELWLVKGRSGATQWVWGSSLLAATEKIVMPTPAGKVTDAAAWNSTYPTSSVLSLGTAAAVNTSTATYTAYLWATKAGISKVFAYTGNGTSLNVDCGFTTGARFILIVRTSASGSVYVWDTVRGVIAGNDPHLALDTTAAEVTTNDSIDPDASGFIVNQVTATNINVTSATYIGLAFA